MAGTSCSPYEAAWPNSVESTSATLRKDQAPADSSDGNARYAAPGYLLFLNDDTLVAQSFDPERLELSGQPIPIAARLGRSSRGDGAFSASNAGTLAYSGGTLRPGRLTWYDRSGNPLGEVGPEGEHDIPDFRLSPDGSRLAASLVDPKVSVPNIWLTDLVRGATSRFTLGPALNAGAVWSPDSGRIAFRSNRKGSSNFSRGARVWRRRPAVAAITRRSRNRHGRPNLVAVRLVTRWAAHRRRRQCPDPTSGSCRLTRTGSRCPVRDPRPTRCTPTSRQTAAIIAYTSNESGRYDVFVEPLPQSDRKWLISTNGGYEPRWRADGREIYYLSEDRKLMAVSVSSGAVPFGVPAALPDRGPCRSRQLPHALRPQP